MESSNSIDAQKKQLRQRLRHLRDGVPAGQLAQFNQAILKNLGTVPEFQAARRVFIYLSQGTEVDTQPLVQAGTRQFEVLALPKVMDKTTMIAVAFNSGDTLVPDVVGIASPSSNKPHPGPYDVVVVPGLGFTRAGIRIGYGRGYYDRWLQKNQVGCKLALAYNLQLLDTLPHESFDVPVDLLVTETDVFYTRPQCD